MINNAQTVVDFVGNPINVGDIIVYSVSIYNSICPTLAKVLDIKSKVDKYNSNKQDYYLSVLTKKHSFDKNLQKYDYI